MNIFSTLLFLCVIISTTAGFTDPHMRVQCSEGRMDKGYKWQTLPSLSCSASSGENAEDVKMHHGQRWHLYPSAVCVCVCVCSRVSRRSITNVWESFPACITGTKPLFCIKHVRGRTLPCARVKAHYINFTLYVQGCVHNSVKMQFHISKSAQLIPLAWIAGILLDNIL